MRRAAILGALVLLLASPASAKKRPPNPPATHATGVALTVIGAINLSLVGVFGGVFVLGVDNVYYRVGVSGMTITGVVGSALLSVGIPLIVMGRPTAASVQLAPNGLRVTF
jgi:hypothetical protein